MKPQRPQPSPSQRAFVYVLFLVCAIVALWVPLYNRAEPALFGVPFFYWFQLSWIVVTAIATAIAYRLRL